MPFVLNVAFERQLANSAKPKCMKGKLRLRIFLTAATLLISCNLVEAASYTLSFTGKWNSAAYYGGTAPAIGDSFTAAVILDTSLPDQVPGPNGLYTFTSPMTFTTAGHTYQSSNMQAQSLVGTLWQVYNSVATGEIDSVPTGTNYLSFGVNLFGNQANSGILPTLSPLTFTQAFLYYNIYNSTNTSLVGGFNILGAIDSYTIVETSVVPLPAALPLFATILAGGGLIAWHRKRKASPLAAA